MLQSETTVFKDVVDKAIALESAKIDCKELAQKMPTPPESVDINKIQFNNKKYQGKENRQHSRQQHITNQPKTTEQSKRKIDYGHLGLEGICFRCGRSNHLSNDCRTDRDNLKCSTCQKKGHVSKVCIKTLLEQKKQDVSIHHVTHVREYGIHQINKERNRMMNSERFQTTVHIEGHPV